MNATLSWGRAAPLSLAVRRLAFFAAALLAAFALAGCSNEPEERKEFISFLKTRIVDKKGGGMPILNTEQKKKLGTYADHYQVIFAFNASMNQGLKSLNDAQGLQHQLNTAQGLQNNWQKLPPLRAELSKAGDLFASELQKAQTARDALKQPDDLKAVYDQAFAKTVTGPATVFKDMLPALTRTFQAAEDIGRFLDDNKARIKMSGSMVQIDDPALLAQFQKLQGKVMAEEKTLRGAMAAFNQLH
jgi:hypothetical protein